jgi:hypothetical protein
MMPMVESEPLWYWEFGPILLCWWRHSIPGFFRARRGYVARLDVEIGRLGIVIW